MLWKLFLGATNIRGGVRRPSLAWANVDHSDSVHGHVQLLPELQKLSYYGDISANGTTTS